MTFDRERVAALFRRAEGALFLHPNTPGLREIREAAEALLDGRETLPGNPWALALYDKIAAGESLASIIPEAWGIMYGPPTGAPKEPKPAPWEA